MTVGSMLTVLLVCGHEQQQTLPPFVLGWRALIPGRLTGTDGLTLLNDVAFNQLIIGFADRVGTDTTQAVEQALNAQGRWFVIEASWKGRLVMRLSFSSGMPVDTSAFADHIIAAHKAVSGHHGRRNATGRG